MALFLPGFPFKTKNNMSTLQKQHTQLALCLREPQKYLRKAGSCRVREEKTGPGLSKPSARRDAALARGARIGRLPSRLRGSASLSFRKERPLGPLPLGPGLNKTTVLAWHWIGHQRIREPNIRSHTSMPLLGVQNMEFVRDPLCLCMQPQHKFDPVFSAQKKSARRCRHVHSIIQD